MFKNAEQEKLYDKIWDEINVDNNDVILKNI